MFNNESKMVQRNMFMGFKRWVSGVAFAGVISFPGCGDSGPIKPDPDPDPKPQRSLTQTFQRMGNLGLNHTLNFQNISSLSSEILKGDSVVWSGNVTNSNYSRTFEPMLKGQYTATSTGGGITKTSNAEILNHMPIIDESCINANLIQGSTTISDLEGCISDINFEDNPSVSRVRSLDEKVDIGYQGNQIFITPKTGSTGEYSFEIKVGDQETGVTTFTGTGNIAELNLPRISGRIENNRTDLGESSQMNVYNGSVSDSNFLGHIDTSDGTFDFQLNEEVEGPLILRTQLDQNSYVRTISIPVADNLGLIIRSHPKDQPYNLRLHMEELNEGFFKWDLTKLKGVEIFDEDPFGRGSFTSAEQDFVETTFRNNLSCYTGNHPQIQGFYIQKDTIGSERHDLENNGRDWIFITRDTTMVFDGLASTLMDGEGIIYKSVIKLNQITQYAISHEQGHSFIAPITHAQTLQSPTTIMATEGAILSSSPGPADCEAGTVLYDDTYTAGSSYNNILGEPSTFDTSLSGTPGMTIIWN